MTIYSEKKLANFDEFCKGKPIEIEKALKRFIPSAKALKNKSIYLQILSRLALTQAAQKKFKLAHKTLDKAEKELTSDQTLAKVRLILERGRVFLISYDFKAALPLIKKGYKLSKKYKFDTFTIDAAHMIPAIVNNVKEKIRWNQIAIDIAKKTRDKKLKEEWLVVLFQAIGLNYIEAKQYKKALSAFEQSKKLTGKFTPKIVILGANIGIAKSLRLLNFLDKALSIQLSLLKECNNLTKENLHPIETNLFYGWVCEELAEIYLKNVTKFSSLAYQYLSKDLWHIKQEPKRLARMNKFKKLC